LRLGQEVQHRLDLQGTAQPILADLARQTGEVAHLIVRQGDHAMCVAHHGASRMLQAFDTVGAPIPLHVGASPKMLLAYAPEDEREQLIKTIRFQRFTPNTIASTKALRKHLDRIVALGYSLDEEDFEAGVCAAGAPVRDHLGHVAAGVTITVPSSRFGPADQARLIRAVRQAAARVSQRLGWQPNRTAADAGRDASEPTPLRAVTVGARTRS